MALSLVATTRENVTRVNGSVSGGTGGTTTLTIFPGPNPQVAPVNGHVSEERVFVKGIRLVGSNTAAGDYFKLTDLGTAETGVFMYYDFAASGDNFVDSFNLGDDLRNGMILTATTGATTNDTNSGLVFTLYIYHGAR